MKFKKEATKNNSIIQILEVLEKSVFLTENEIFIEAFGYDRNFHTMSNKKYADMLRRGLAKKWITRMDNRVHFLRNDIGKSRFVYIITTKGMGHLWEYQAKLVA